MSDLLDAFAANPDASEIHGIEITASPEVVYRALWTADLGDSIVVKGLLALRSLPAWLSTGRRPLPSRELRLENVLEAGFGRLAEEPGREVVLGVTGRFWRPTGNLEPFDREAFAKPVEAGTARAVWNFRVSPLGDHRTLLSTETRVMCGDAASRRKFRIYWLLVRPFSGLIRRIMLGAIRREAESRAALTAH